MKEYASEILIGIPILIIIAGFLWNFCIYPHLKNILAREEEYYWQKELELRKATGHYHTLHGEDIGLSTTSLIFLSLLGLCALLVISLISWGSIGIPLVIWVPAGLIYWFLIVDESIVAFSILRGVNRADFD